ncbi:ATP-dependent helicase (plasmid) [Vibrio campbellii]|uniref:ATP-dependent helicase n=1 Tax=Vibrio campbellii TaxID=680 RepID=UPI001F07D062|nr:ATP-dependent helicase [Vibrio campbellii]UMM06646.1 ATP-dependent helicase [Vibrio campbellii]
MKPTDEQLALINFTGGNALVDAGPGTGKTTTLIEFILQRMQYTPATTIAVLMFNSDIQKDFQKRMKERGVMDMPTIKTFHGMAMNILKQSGHLNRTGFDLNMDDGGQQMQLARDSLKVIADNTRSRKIASIIRESKTADILLSFIGLVKAQMLPVKEVFADAGISMNYSFLIPAFYEFEKSREAARTLFFDDWVPEVVKLLKNDAKARHFYQQKFSLLLIDEFQDINASQYEMVRLLKSDSANVIVVGDVDQSIYSWRGSNPGFMLTFDKEFEPCTRLTLSKTFRYGHQLSLVANHLISNNKHRFDSLTTPAVGTPQTQVEVIPTAKPAADIVTSIQSYMAGGGEPANCAVLIRRWSQAMLFELSFLLKRIPYAMPPQFALPNSREIKLLNVLLTFVTGTDQILLDNERSNMIYELLRYPHTYVPNTALMDISRRLCVVAPEQWPSAVDAIMMANTNSKHKLENVRERLAIVANLSQMREKPAYEVFNQYVEDTDMEEWLQNSSASTSDFQEAMERIVSLATVLKTMNLSCLNALDYFRRLVLLSKETTKRKQGVTLTTMFRAKGCEYDTVLLPYWDADVMPMKNNNEAGMGTDEEEERRLAYVGMTRAKHNLKIFHNAAPDDEPLLSKASKFIRESNYKHSSLVAHALYSNSELPELTSPISARYVDKMA